MKLSEMTVEQAAEKLVQLQCMQKRGELAHLFSTENNTKQAVEWSDVMTETGSKLKDFAVSNPGIVAGLGGALAGGAVGALTAPEEKRKRRALQGALAGALTGLGGVGAYKGYQMLNKPGPSDELRRKVESVEKLESAATGGDTVTQGARMALRAGREYSPEIAGVAGGAVAGDLWRRALEANPKGWANPLDWGKMTRGNLASLLEGRGYVDAAKAVDSPLRALDKRLAGKPRLQALVQSFIDPNAPTAREFVAHKGLRYSPQDLRAAGAALTDLPEHLRDAINAQNDARLRDWLQPTTTPRNQNVQITDAKGVTHHVGRDAIANAAARARALQIPRLGRTALQFGLPLAGLIGGNMLAGRAYSDIDPDVLETVKEYGR